jgi:transposase
VSALVAISVEEVITYEMIDKSYNSVTFRDFLCRLIPQLKEHQKYILMDNVSFHHNREALQLLQENSIRPLFIPPYSPEYNPIEEVFSVVKRRFRYLLVNGSTVKGAVSGSFAHLKGSKASPLPFYQHSAEYWKFHKMAE